VAQRQLWAEASRRLLDFTQERLPEMDRFSLDVQVLSLNSPGIQAEPEAAVAVRAVLAVNDLPASVIGDHPDRGAAWRRNPLG
jgi:2,3-dihydroxybenzoate decarboxylase